VEDAMSDKTPERIAYEKSVEAKESPDVQEHKRKKAILSEAPKAPAHED
jgi:hypothetical protein